jgi:hypothetical protein
MENTVQLFRIGDGQIVILKRMRQKTDILAVPE